MNPNRAHSHIRAFRIDPTLLDQTWAQSTHRSFSLIHKPFGSAPNPFVV